MDRTHETREPHPRVSDRHVSVDAGPPMRATPVEILLVEDNPVTVA
jgi:hypothetical protein